LNDILNAEKKINLDEVDWSQLQRNLSLPIEKRLEEHQKAMELVTYLEEAGREARKKLYEQPQQPA
jgi:hypothetical protein